MFWGILLALALFLGSFPSLFAETTPIKITLVAFGGTVKIKSADGKVISPTKGVEIPVGSILSTGFNSFMDLDQGGLSVVRVMTSTRYFVIKESSLDPATGLSSTLFSLQEGSAFVRANDKVLVKGSKYQVEMPNLVAYVMGSECEVVANDKPLPKGNKRQTKMTDIDTHLLGSREVVINLNGDSICHVKGSIKGTLSNGKGIEWVLANNEILFVSGEENMGASEESKDLQHHLLAVSNSLPEPKGGVLDGVAVIGTPSGQAGPSPREDLVFPGIQESDEEEFGEAALLTAPPPVNVAPVVPAGGSAKLGNAIATPPPSPPLAPPPPASP